MGYDSGADSNRYRNTAEIERDRQRTVCTGFGGMWVWVLSPYCDLHAVRNRAQCKRFFFACQFGRAFRGVSSAAQAKLNNLRSESASSTFDNGDEQRFKARPAVAVLARCGVEPVRYPVG